VAVDPTFCDPANLVVSPSLCAQRGKFLTSSVGYGYRLDRRNDPIQATRGFFAEINQDLAGIGGDVKYVRTEGDAGWYHGFTKSFILSVTGSAGYVGGWSGDHVRINDRFFRGGNNFRGFQIAGIGPRDLNGGQNYALGGKAYALGSVELTVPTFLPEQYGIKAALFTDVGTAGLLDKADKLCSSTPFDAAAAQACPPGTVDPNIKDNLGLRASAGLSVFWKSPMGPIRFDFSRVLAKESYDKTELFRFSTTTNF
jgi:outer membrane protein insertion porin family